MPSWPGFVRTQLDARHDFLTGALPAALTPAPDTFEALWALHPQDYHEIVIHGRRVSTPRWQQAYGRDYVYTGRVNAARPVPPILAPLADWCRAELDARLNGLLLNWYDGELGHYIGKHRDSLTNLIPGSPIVTISLGVPRLFRLRPWRAEGAPQDFPTSHGSVFIMPFATNLAWTHEVPKRAGGGRRISVTLRAFE